MKQLIQILLVDDDQTNNYLNRSLLEGLGIADQIVVLDNGRQALEYLLAAEVSPESLPQLVIIDHFMPVMDGLELMQALNRTGFIKRHEIVFLLLAIHTSPEDLAAFEKLGVQEYTPKPLSPQVVLSAYQKYFAHDTARDHLTQHP
jgi:CheY-like chemotaxis protein